MTVCLPSPVLGDILENAFAPCGLFGTCPEARWDPLAGHVPRGFLGATGECSDVRLVMVFAEPGHPYDGDCYDADAGPQGLLAQTVENTHRFMAEGRDKFHRNVRWFIEQIYPDLSFEQALQHVWLTEGRLCSVDREAGGLSDPTCANHYLVRQLDLMPQAVVVAFGNKAQRYLSRARIVHVPAFSLAPPGADQRRARPSWQAAIAEVRKVT